MPTITFTIRTAGTTQVMGQSIPNIVGGFGTNNRGIMVNTLAALYKITPDEINRFIDGEERDLSDVISFINGVDIIAVDPLGSRRLLIDNGIMTQDAIDATKKIWLLSKHGYLKLVRTLTGADDIFYQLMHEYFHDDFGLGEFLRAAFDGIFTIKSQAIIDKYRVAFKLVEPDLIEH